MQNEKSFVNNVQVLVGITTMWDYFFANLPDFQDAMVVVAMNESNHCEICVTEKLGFPAAVVYINDRVVDEDMFVEKYDLEYGMRYYYAEYLMNPNAESEYADVEPAEDATEVTVEDFEELQDIVDSREDDIYSAFLSFLEEVCDREPSVIYDEENAEVLQETFEEVIRVIGEDFGWPVHRPQIVEDENGKMDFVLYPYDEDGVW